MGPNKLIDGTTELVEANLDRRALRHRIISRNISNLDTPHFSGTGLEFEKQLRTAIEGGVMPANMARTHPGHMPQAPSKPFSNAKPVYKDTGQVQLDIEMSRLAENNIMFNAMVQILNKKMSKIRTAIQESK